MVLADVFVFQHFHQEIVFAVGPCQVTGEGGSFSNQEAGILSFISVSRYSCLTLSVTWLLALRHGILSLVVS